MIYDQKKLKQEYHSNRVAYILEKLYENIHSNETHKNNNDNNTTLIFIGLHKPMQKHKRHMKKVVQVKRRVMISNNII